MLDFNVSNTQLYKLYNIGHNNEEIRRPSQRDTYKFNTLNWSEQGAIYIQVHRYPPAVTYTATSLVFAPNALRQMIINIRKAWQ